MVWMIAPSPLHCSFLLKQIPKTNVLKQIQHPVFIKHEVFGELILKVIAYVKPGTVPEVSKSCI